MECYRSKLQKRKIGFTCTTMIAVIVNILNSSIIVSNSQNGSFAEGRIAGFSTGIITAFGLISIIKVMQLRKILKDEKLIKLQYNKEHDERQQAIRIKAGMPMILIMSIVMIIASLIGGYFNEVVFYTLFIAGTVQLFVGVVLKIYFMKTM